jgi:hypothetical protein
MRSLIDSLSFGSGSLVAAMISLVLVATLSRFSSVRWYPLWAVLIPFVVAYCLYWSPVWLGNDPSEYSIWSGMVISVWFVAGASASSALLFFLHKRRKAQQKTQSEA